MSKAQNPIKYKDHYEKKRIYAREVSSQRYTLTEERRQRLDDVPRVMHCDVGDGLPGEWHLLAPGDEPFRTQSLQCHWVVLPAGGRNEGHGHQNEAFFYILEGRGFELHDNIRYDWQQGDAVIVHNDCVHWHNNADPDHRAVALVMKAKPTWLFLGLHQQGQLGTAPAEDDDRWEPRSEWAVARAPEDVALKKVISAGDTPWELTPHGHIRWLAAAHVPFRAKAIDAYLQEIPPGGRSGRRWQMADELFYVLDGEGYDLHWEVNVEISDQFYARIAKEPTRWQWRKGDMVWIPHNTIFQHFNSDPSRPATLLCASNRLYKHLGYSRIEQLENAPEYDATQVEVAAPVGD